METNGLDRELVCLLFPGIVKNDSKALQCLGGIRTMSQVYSQPTKKRLGLSYQPENPHVKKIYADLKRTAGVLLKIKVKKTKVENEVKREVISTTIVGHVKKIYKFESMCDFQYLPVQIEGVLGKPQCILEQIIPSGLDNVNFMTGPASLFIVPANFTRSDRPINYCYTDKRYPEKKDETDVDDIVHNKRRGERGLPKNRIAFNLIDDLPPEPQEYYIKQYSIKCTVHPTLKQDFEHVKELFAQRPIWSLNLIRYRTKIKLPSLKVILPCLALYMKDGPWRMLWIKFGYDPRKEPGSRIFQTLDFRLRHTAGVRSMVMTRDEIMHFKKADRVRSSASRLEAVEGPPYDSVPEGAVCFRPGMAPSQRQIFYQYCDVELPEVQDIISAEPPAGYLCHEKRGWLPPGSDQVCRDHIFRYVQQTLLATHNEDVKYEQASSDEDSNSEDDCTSTNELDDVSNT